MREFRLQALPWNVVFGAGKLASLPDELDALGFSRALVLSTPEQAGDATRIAGLLGDRTAATFCEAQMHVPVEVAERAQAVAEANKADCSVSIGGGSTTGLGKALALRIGLPLIAIPTTYAGSEMTNIWGMTDAGAKKTGRDIVVLPRLTIYDPELTLGLPAKIAGPSGINALAQAIASASDPTCNPVIMSMALEAIGAVARALPRVMEAPDDIEPRDEMLYGACLAGAALGAGTTGLHHRLCHTLGGSYKTPHAETHTIILPQSVAYNTPAVPEQMQRIAAAMNAASAARGIYDLATSMDLPVSLQSIGIEETDIETIARIATENPVDNPAPVTFAGVVQLLRNAYAGARPE